MAKSRDNKNVRSVIDPDRKSPLRARGAKAPNPPKGALKTAANHSVVAAAAIVRRIVASRHDRPSLVSELACELGAEIIEAVRTPGADLNSATLATHYRTSRTPIREALMLLEKEGLVDVPPRRRPRVATQSAQAIREIYEVRAALVGMVAATVASTATEAQIAELKALVDKMQVACDAGDSTSYLWASLDFHERNTMIAGNQTVKRILDSLVLRTLPHRRRFSLAQPGALEQSCRDHVYLIRAYEGRDPTLASAIVRSNIFKALSRIETALQQSADAQPPKRTRRKSAATR
jgi:DNA-binding GntR family transcriptional regulator